jgi:hypothetical protein
MANDHTAYVEALRKNFSDYRGKRFAEQDQLFEDRTEEDRTEEDRPKIGPVVFQKPYADHNILMPPSATPQQQTDIIKSLPKTRRHKHFRSMQSSQALVQSIFGTIKVFQQSAMLSAIVAENDQPAFGPRGNGMTLVLEKKIKTLGEQPTRETSADVWWSTDGYQVAVECKLGEEYFGKCSRPTLKLDDPEYCDGNYARRKGGEYFCALTEIGVQYWDHLNQVCGSDWAPNVEHRPCPLEPTYQLIRNILAACVSDDRKLDIGNGHALVIYDERNPTMSLGGKGHDQWVRVTSALKAPNCLRRISWQSFIGQWPSNEVLDWLKEEVAEKYGLLAHRMRVR